MTTATTLDWNKHSVVKPANSSGLSNATVQPPHMQNTRIAKVEMSKGIILSKGTDKPLDKSGPIRLQ